MIGYRGFEAVDCFGMQPIVEPDLGLCDNLKPNRLFGAERKRFYRALRLQGSLLYQENHVGDKSYESITKISQSLERNN